MKDANAGETRKPLCPVPGYDNNKDNNDCPLGTTKYFQQFLECLFLCASQRFMQLKWKWKCAT